ncbi:MAG: GNAT family N-acetyltransferase [Planctomycetia bacterium]|nr:GNAT family N-acetyltransferase [Planctomycetia bacterium]
MAVSTLHNKEQIHNFLLCDPEYNSYLIGDLDDFFWHKTIWYADIINNKIEAMALLYVGTVIPCLLAFYNNNPTPTKVLIKKIKPMLPKTFLAHLSPRLIDEFGKENIIEHYGYSDKMALRSIPKEIKDNKIRHLNFDDAKQVQELFSIANPINWFDKSILHTGLYLGYFNNKRLIGVAGIHSYSKEYKVASLGNIATHPNHRRQQISYKLTSQLCFELMKTVTHIGLNVRTNNNAAINCYKKIGFEFIGNYDECKIKNTYT